MRRSVAALGFLLAGLCVSPGAGTEIEEDCPAVDPLASFRFHRYPPEQKSVLKAEFDAHDSSAGQSGKEGVDRIVRIVLASHRGQCAPVSLVILHGGADFDSRGTAFEDHVSIERALTAMNEISQALEPARKAAVARGEIADIPLLFSFGGIGSRGAVHENPTSEAERAENRFVSVRFAHSPAAAPAPEVMPPQESSGED